MFNQESKLEADRLRKDKKFDQALIIYQKLWANEKKAWNGYFVALCLRQDGQLIECRQFHDEFEKLFPGMPAMKSERLWLDYKQYIKDYDYPDFVEAGTQILAQSNQYSKETDKVYIKTVLAVVQRLSYSPTEKLEWLNKLDQSILDNNVFRFNDIAYPADRKRYFIEYANCLVDLGKHNQYIGDKMCELGFSGIKHNEFLKHITESFTFKDYKGSVHVNKLKLALVLKILAEETHLRQGKNIENIYIKNKTLSVSDLSHYTFCPVSYAIHRTFKIYSSESWQKDEWKKEKLYLADRYKRFHEANNFEYPFEDTRLALDHNLKEKFAAIFKSKMELNNATSKEPSIMKGNYGKINGAPDYIFLHPKNIRYVVTEKFSHKNSADSNVPFESDLIKHYAFLSEFESYGINFGLFLTWYYSHEEVENGKEGEKKIVINDYRLVKVKIDPKNKVKLHERIEAVKLFNEDGRLDVDGRQISYPKKCLSCSVVSYCHHKTGLYNQIELPYVIKGLDPRAGLSI
jgi:CRISPR/Cas system-associated exonuclease Cas4 (RecB family)